MDHGHLTLVLAQLPGLGWIVRRVARAWRDATVPSMDPESVIGSFERLRWLADDSGVPDELASRACARAAHEGRLDVLRWALKRGLRPDSTACEAAARGGHIDVLMLLRAHACPWGGRCYDGAPMEVKCWLRDQMCPGSFYSVNQILGCTGSARYTMDVHENTLQPMISMPAIMEPNYHLYFTRRPAIRVYLPPLKLHVPKNVYAPHTSKPGRPRRAPVCHVPARHAAAHTRPLRGRLNRR